jgi:Na+-transporting methylmalonyl-CoA/oxaloacetate decarboxylase gamma subunit
MSSPTATATAFPPLSTPTAGMAAVFYLVPLAVVAILIILCTAIRVIPFCEFQFFRPKITTTEEVQINYSQEDCEVGSVDTVSVATQNDHRRSVRDSIQSLAQRPSTLSLSLGPNIPLKEMQSKDSMIYVIEGNVSQLDESEPLNLRPVRSSAMITVGEPPNYSESLIDSPRPRPSLDLIPPN